MYAYDVYVIMPLHFKLHIFGCVPNTCVSYDIITRKYFHAYDMY